MPKVSVVIPVYNVEKYLRQCVDSVLAQTLSDIEIILVDDGSPDKCPQIIDEYAAKDKRVKPVRQPNGGYGRAVNHGIEIAKGEYIAILESDDWVEPDMYERLYKNAAANNSDAVKCSFYIYDSTQKDPAKINLPWKEKNFNLFDAPDGAFNLKDFPQIMLFHASVWAAVYRAGFIKNIKMIEAGKTMYQDFPFTCEVLAKTKRLSVEKAYLAHYRMEHGQNSSIMQKNEKTIQMVLRCIDAVEILKKNNVLDLVKEEIYYRAYSASAGFFYNTASKFKRAYFEEMRRLFAPLSGDKTFKFKYFSGNERRVCKAVIAGNFYGAALALGWQKQTFRKSVLSVRLPVFRGKNARENYTWNIQILGFQFGDGAREDIPAFHRFIKKEKQ